MTVQQEHYHARCYDRERCAGGLVGHDSLEWPLRNAGASLTPGLSPPIFGTTATLTTASEYPCADAYAALADQERIPWQLMPDDAM